MPKHAARRAFSRPTTQPRTGRAVAVFCWPNSCSNSIYDLSKLKATFDIVLCLGVYYHLIDPMLGFAQLRRCCHPGSTLVLEGDVTLSLRPDTVFWDPQYTAEPMFVPTPYSLKQMLQAAYFDVASQTWCRAPHSPSLLRRMRMYPALFGLRAPATGCQPDKTERMVTVCAPFEGENPLYPYRPPFGLHHYDPRFRGSGAM